MTTPLLQLPGGLARGLTAAVLVLGPDTGAAVGLALAGERVAMPSGTSSSLRGRSMDRLCEWVGEWVCGVRRCEQQCTRARAYVRVRA